MKNFEFFIGWLVGFVLGCLLTWSLMRPAPETNLGRVFFAVDSATGITRYQICLDTNAAGQVINSGRSCRLVR